MLYGDLSRLQLTEHQMFESSASKMSGALYSGQQAHENSDLRPTQPADEKDRVSSVPTPTEEERELEVDSAV